MTIEKIALCIATLALVLGGFAVFSVGGESGETLAGNTSYQKQSFMEGLFAGTGRQFEVSRAGAVTASGDITTTSGSDLLLTTSNSATSTATIGCVQTYATSTATAVRFLIGSIATTSPSHSGNNSIGHVLWGYGSCPI